MARASIVALERWLTGFRGLPDDLRRDIRNLIDAADKQRLEIEVLRQTVEELRRDQADDAKMLAGLETALAVARHELKNRREVDRLERGG